MLMVYIGFFWFGGDYGWKWWLVIVVEVFCLGDMLDEWYVGGVVLFFLYCMFNKLLYDFLISFWEEWV